MADSDQSPRELDGLADLLRAALGDAEDPLRWAWPAEEEAYRFTWRSSFDGTAAVHIGRDGGTVTLRWIYQCFAVVEDSSSTVLMPPTDWHRLLSQLNATRFWFLASSSDRFGMDGADWLIEGRRRKHSHRVKRWSPDDAIKDLGRLFFSLAGPPLADVRLYWTSRKPKRSRATQFSRLLLARPEHKCSRANRYLVRTN